MFWNTFIYQHGTPVPIQAHLATHHSVILRRCLFYLGCRFLLIHATGSPVLINSLVLSLLLAGISVSVTVSCDEDVGQVDEEEELVDKPSTTNGTWFGVSRWNFLPILMRCGFWPFVQWKLYPKSSQSFPSERTAGVFSRSINVTNKSSSLTYTIASSFAGTSPLAVTTIIEFFGILTVSNSALLKSFLLTMCMLAPESATNSLSSEFIVDAASKIHSSEGE